jgi:L-methionine (R)-S-oxide reductase
MTGRKLVFAELMSEIQTIVKKSSERDEALGAICGVLFDGVAWYDWIGFYLVAGEGRLVLGPYSGESTEHTEIGFGEGICGQAAEREQTFLIQDISKETNYLSCSPSVKSEIVIPIFRGGKIVGELDIDSHTLAPFTDDDSTFLQGVADIAAEILG